MLGSVECWLTVAHKSVFRYSQRWQHPSIRPRYMNSPFSKPFPEHDVVPEGSVDIQVYLFDLRREATSLELHFLEEKDKETCWKSPRNKPLRTLKMKSPLVISPHIFLCCPVWLSRCPAAKPRPALGPSEGCLYTHASPTEQTHTRAKEPHKSTISNKRPRESSGFRKCGFL